MQALFNPRLGPLRGENQMYCGVQGGDKLVGVRRVRVVREERDIVKPNLVAQECLPLFKLCGTEDAEVIK